MSSFNGFATSHLVHKGLIMCIFIYIRSCVRMCVCMYSQRMLFTCVVDILYICINLYITIHPYSRTYRNARHTIYVNEVHESLERVSVIRHWCYIRSAFPLKKKCFRANEPLQISDYFHSLWRSATL